jgi:ABC-type multidrug transport system fused ATPase/permease subunit
MRSTSARLSDANNARRILNPWPSPIRSRRLPSLASTKMPRSIWGLVWHLSATDQIWAALLSIAVALLDTAPIEVQRRIVNGITQGHEFQPILILTSIYAALVLVQGLTKLLLNIYRSWIAENSVRALRSFVGGSPSGRNAKDDKEDARTQGTEISIVLAETDPVGTFVGASVSEPLLQISILVSVFGYLAYLRPLMALVALAVLSPQFVFIPLIQRAINLKVSKRIATLRGASAGMVGQQSDVRAALRRQETRFFHVFRLNMIVFKLKFTLNFLMNLSHHVGIASILGIGGWLVVGGKTEVGTVVAFISGMATIKDPWGDLVTWYQTLMVTRTKFGLIADAVQQKGPARSAVGEESGEVAFAPE